MMNMIKSEQDLKRQEYFENLLNELRTTIESTDEADYVTKGMYDLYSMLISNEQYGDTTIDQPVAGKKLIMSNRYIPNAYLDYYEANRVVLGKLFIEADVWLLPTELVHNCTSSNRFGAIIHPELYGLPSEHSADYGTLRVVNSRISTVLVKGTWINGWIDRNYQYEYVTLGMN